MAVDLDKTEYNYLLALYLDLAQFQPMTSTFKFIEKGELKELNLTIGVLQRKLSEIMPKVQDREINATNKRTEESRSDYNSKRII